VSKVFWVFPKLFKEVGFLDLAGSYFFAELNPNTCKINI